MVMWPFGQSLGGDLGSAALMRRIGVGMQEMDDQRSAAGLNARRRTAMRISSSSSGVRTVPGCLDALGNLEPQIARDCTGTEDAGHAVGLRPGAAAEFDRCRGSRAW